MYLSQHPLDPFKDDLEGLCTPLSQIAEFPVDKVVRVGGLIRSRRTRLNKDGREFAFLELEDFSGVCEVAFWPNAWNADDQDEGEKVRDLAQEGGRVVLVARVREARDRSDDSSGDQPATKALEGVKAMPLSKARARIADTLHLQVDTRALSDASMEKVRSILGGHPGRCRVLFHARSPQGNWTLESRSAKVLPDAELVSELRSILGDRNVAFSTRQELPRLEQERRYPPRRPAGG
jgi:DNA polymerase III subunit alpha